MATCRVFHADCDGKLPIATLPIVTVLLLHLSGRWRPNRIVHGLRVIFGRVKCGNIDHVGFPHTYHMATILPSGYGTVKAI
jgi:hypothetical protein